MSKSIVINDDYRNVLPRFSDKYFDLAVCDIPYGIDVGNMAFLKEVNTSIKQKNGSRMTPKKSNDKYSLSDWDKEPPPQEYFDELKRVSKHQIIFGIEYVNWSGVGNGRIKWNKGVPDGVSFKKYEMAYCSLIYNEVELPLLWAGMQQAKSISEPMTSQGNKKLNEKRIHPCHKPIMLYDKIFLDYGFKGMKVIDTHLGSGSSRISADKFGVDEFVGIEIDKSMIIKHEKRWVDYKSQIRLF